MPLHRVTFLVVAGLMLTAPAMAQVTPLELVNEFYEDFQQAEIKYSTPHLVNFRIGKAGTTAEGINLVAYNEAPRHANGMPADTIWTMVCAFSESWEVLDTLLGETHTVRVVGILETGQKLVEFDCELL